MIGSHLSVAGGMHLAVVQALTLGLECVQVFTKNQQQWKAPPLAASSVRAWQDAVAQAGWGTSPGRLVSHASYLINLASPDPELAAKSLALMGDEIDRCEALGVGLLVFHPGSSTTGSTDEGVRAIAGACAKLLAQRPGGRTVLCLENVVGAGATIGGPFEQLALIRRMTIDLGAPPGRLGFCIDTCHAHSFGYDCATTDAASRTIDLALGTLGESTIRCLHLNDSMTPLGSKRDRHQHIGEGSLGGGPGLGGFGAFMRHPAFELIPKIMETPKGQRARKPAGAIGAEAQLDFDQVNAGRLRLVAQAGDAPAAWRLVPMAKPLAKPATKAGASRSKRAAKKPKGG
jgi:deoxyribonuclease-4